MAQVTIEYEDGTTVRWGCTEREADVIELKIMDMEKMSAIKKLGDRIAQKENRSPHRIGA